MLFQQQCNNYQFVKPMPKQLKNRQSRDNSQIFKEAKRRFHYEPKQLIHPYFLHSKAKRQDRQHGFKQDYSSVKDLKNENNEINESSWIAKLVNGIQQQFTEEHQPKKQTDVAVIEGSNYFSEPVDPENVVIVTAKNFKPLPVTGNTSFLNSSNPTKKNSFNFYKRNEEKRGVRNTDKALNRAGSSDTISVKDASHSKRKKQVKPSVSLNSKKSPRMKSKSEISMKTGVRAKIKSLQNIKRKKQSEGKSQGSLNGGNTKCVTDKTVEQPRKSNKSVPKSNFIKKHSPFTEQPLEIQEIACHTDKKLKEDNYDSINQKIDIILSNDRADSLFENKTRLQSNAKQQAKPIIRPLNYGSIKKNQITKTQQNAPVSKRSFGSIGSESYKQDSIPTFSQKYTFFAQRAINERPIEENELVTPRQEQALIEKYLRSDNGFKSHKLNTNEGREMIKSPYKRDAKRYAYKIEGITEEEINTMEEIPTLREKVYFAQNREVSDRMASTFGHENQKEIFQDYRPGRRPVKHENVSLRSEIEKQRRLEHANKQNITTLSTRKNSINQTTANNLYPKVSPQTIRERQEKSWHLNREVYMHESDKNSALQSLLSSNKQKLTPKSAVKEQGVVPSKYSYLCANSTLQQSAQISKQKQDEIRHASPISQISINRLTSKLNSYITQHQLHREQGSSNESSHRMLQLNFKELKKHNDFNRPAEKNDLFLF